MKISLWSILKDSIGKDLSKISMPVYFNEPLSMLQKCCETLEYNSLLDEATKQESSMVRLGLIAAHQVSGLAGQDNRNTKPFNPLLGETYELITPTFRYFSEQVCHHPPISAFHCNGSNYEIFSQSAPINKFNGRSLTIQYPNRVYIKLTKPYTEMYSCELPNSSANNLLIGTPYIDIYGKVKITNHTT